MLFVKNQLMFLSIIYTSFIINLGVASYDSRQLMKDKNQTDKQNSTITTGDPCESHGCNNGGSCYISRETAICLCPHGYRGLHCEEATEDSCATYSCHNGGTCYILEGSAKCLCPSGYRGSHCEEETDDPCVPFGCYNGGTCHIYGGSAKCLCPSGYRGSHCEEAISPCSSMPCQNEGFCMEEERSFKCYCKPPYRGTFCEKDPCTGNPCQNGGTCVQTNYSFKCLCRYPYFGDTCQYVDACEDNPCFNGGTCEKDGHSFKCNCRYGYYGIICEKEGYISTPDYTSEFEDKSLSTVENEGNHTESTHDPTKFPLNFNLTTMKPGICATDTDCFNKGVCRISYCECLPNFGGYKCEKNLLCEKLKPTCRAMGATCKIVGLNAICGCPEDKMYDPNSGICEDICDPWKCIHGRCEIDGRTYKCICNTGYSGYKCDEIVELKVERSYGLFAVIISVLVFICLLLIAQMCISCRNQKFNLDTRDKFLSECASSGFTASDA